MNHDRLYEFEVLHEIAMAIGVSLDRDAMLKQCLPLFLRRLRCTLVTVVADGPHIVTSVPRSADVQSLLPQIDETLRAGEPLPVLVENGRHLYMWRLEDFGALVLGRARPFSQDLVQEIGQLAGRLAVALHACDKHARLKDLAREATWLAHHDDLTGLYGRRFFLERLDTLSSTAPDAPDGFHGLIYLDLDQFKIVNDTAGHMAGDRLLQELGALLRSADCGADTIARLGGDEFGILIANTTEELAQRTAETLLRVVRTFLFNWQEREFRLSASAGVALFEDSDNHSRDILAAADTACYMAKERGGDRIQTYSIDDGELSRRHSEMHLAAHLSSVIEHGGFVLHAQRIQPLVEGVAERIEILVRMQSRPNEALVTPGHFIPAAERFGLMGAIDRWVVSNTFALRNTLARSSDRVSWNINLSGNSLSDPAFLRFVTGKIREHAPAPGAICFEITETAVVSNLEAVSAFILELRELGCEFALDDFGSGLSSFAYLQQLPVDYLKIDGRFVRDLASSPTDRAIVESIHHIGGTLGIRTIAEYVEDATTMEILRNMGIELGQGFHIHTPEPLEDLLATGEDDTVRRA
ncbi:bifunctional diguanylate cyclase/phosphodiesterase [Thioalkalivibrio sp. ALJT]|uniref:putative bifunctional diguanylate cyclase/phosphodiesterase n=1 Tax=Thioalkalivibrio sp. ALJT TaxID=1158146 RepID=UPI0003A19280|nr:EAL domain-containing protein [Thioalkalivibrio sp. ALJT]